jgi:hypothetical protein
MRRGASWTAAYHLQLTVAAVARPVRSSVGALGVLAAERSWLLLARRSVQPVSSGRASSPCRHCQQASHGVGRRCPPIRFRRPGSGCPAVRVRSPGVVPRVQRSAVCCPPVQRPAVCCPPVRCPPRPVSSRRVSAPSVRTRPSPPILRRWRWGPGRGGRATVTQEWVEPWWRPGRRRLDRRSRRPGRGRRCRRRVGQGRSVADPGRRVGCGPRRPRLPTGRPGRPGRRAERPSRAAARWAREQAAARGCRSGRVAGVLGLGARPRWVVVAAPAVRVGGPGGATGRAGADGRAAPARPKPAASAPG